MGRSGRQCPVPRSDRPGCVPHVVCVLAQHFFGDRSRSQDRHRVSLDRDHCALQADLARAAVEDDREYPSATWPPCRAHLTREVRAGREWPAGGGQECPGDRMARTRRATVSKPADASSEIPEVSARGTTSVNGPGQ